MQEEIQRLDELIEKGVKLACSGLDRVGVIFSGGIDSTLVALKARKYCEVDCYTVGFPDGKDFQYAKIAGENGLKLKEIELNLEILENAIVDVVNLVKKPNPLAVGVGVPMYLASKHARSDGHKVMLCGQGSDELFGGYWRYVEAYVKKGPKAVLDWMVSDVKTADADNLDRDRLVTSANGIELRFPLLLPELIEYSLNLPLEMRILEVDKDNQEYECIDEVDDRYFIRKYIFRKVSELNDVPKPIIDRKKKAAQYGSSVHKNMDKLARSKGFKQIAHERGEKHYLGLYLESLIR